MNGVRKARKEANAVKGNFAKQGTHPKASTGALKQRIDGILKSVEEQRGVSRGIGERASPPSTSQANKISGGRSDGSVGSAPAIRNDGNDVSLKMKPKPKPTGTIPKISQSGKPLIARSKVLPFGKGQGRIYTINGKFHTASRVVDSIKPFEERMNGLKKAGFVQGAVGIAESSVYRGSSTIEHDFVDKGVRGTRVAGNQFLGELDLGSTNKTVGQRLFMRMMQPEALGSLLAKFAKLFEQCKFNGLKIVYKPLVPSTVTGGIAFWHQNDLDSDLDLTGEQLLKQAGTHEAFIDGNVWTPMSVDVKPSDTLMRYWSDSSGEFESEAQGLLTVVASGTLALASLPGAIGHFYLEYDMTFWSPSLDAEVDEVYAGILTVNWDTYSAVIGNVIGATGIPGIVATEGRFEWGDAGPQKFDVVAYGVVDDIEGDAIPYYTDGSGDPKTLAIGDGIAVKFGGDITSWVNGTCVCQFYKNLAEAGSDEGLPLLWNATGTKSTALTLKLSTVDIGAGDEE